MDPMKNMEQQLSHLESQVKGVDQKVNGVDQRMKTMDEKVEKILMFMRGNDLDKDDKGLIGEVNDLRYRMEKMEKLRDRGYIVFGAMGFTSGMGIWKLIQIIFNK